MRWAPVNGLSTPSVQGAYSLQLATAKPAASPRRALHCILPLTKTRVSLPSYSQRVHLHVVRKRHVTTTERYFASQAKDHLGSAVLHVFFPPVLGSPFHQLQLCMPILGYHCLCPCGQGGKAAFQRARTFSPRHEYAPFFVVLYSFP